MAITLTFDQPDAGIPAGSVDRGRTDIKSTGPIGSPRAHPVTITVGNIPTAALVDVVLLDEPPGANPLLTELAPETWQLEFDVGCWGPFRVRVTATASDAVVSSVTRRISIRSPGYHIDYPGLAERYDPNATAVPTVPSVEITEMNEGSTNRPLVNFHRQLVVAIEGGVGGGGVIPDGSITEEKLAPELSDNLLRADGTIPFTADQNAAGNTVANLGTPTAAGDAVPLSYLNASFVLSGIRTPVRLVATVPITASNTQVVDSKPTVNGDRVLLTAQPSPVDNGIFVANDAGAWLRATDADASVDMLPGVVVFVTDGTEHAESGWILATDAPIALGTSPLTYARFTGAAQLVAGAGLTKTANTVDVVAHADGSLVVSADAVQVGTLATDAQHGARGGGTQHAASTPSVAGFQSAADKTKLDGISSGAAALSSSAPANVGTTAAVGAGTTAARADHVHAHAAQTDGTLHAAATPSVAGFQSAADKTKLDGISSGAAALSSTTPAAVAFTGAVGVGTTAARADHVHAHAAQTDGTLHAAATPSVAGFQSAADKTKLDTIATSAAALTATAPTQITVTTAAAGVETAAAKGDHVHSVSTGAPAALAVGGAQSTGSATSLARSDHQHAMPAVATTGADGFMSAADKTRLDGMATAAAALTSTAPVNVDNAAAAVGVGTTAARHDHRHTVSIGTPVALTVGGTNAQGSATSLVRSDHTHALPGVVTTGADGFASAADKTKLDGIETGAQVTSFARVQTALGVASSPVSLNSQKITNVLNPTADQEVATKSYVDAVASGLDLKTSCRLVATTNVTASGVQVIDGVTTATGDRLLLTSQTAPATNGIYVASGVTWLRAADADVSVEVTSGLYTYITEGTANADSGWALTTNDPIVLGTTALVFTQISGAGQITAGAALTKTGNTLDVAVHGDGSIVVNADSLQIGVIATDAQHGARAGGTTHAAVIAGGASGFMTGSDKTKLDGIATGAAAVLSVTPLQVDGSSGNGGAAVTASRSDHRHQVTTGTPVALTLAASTADGTSNNLARADHVHALPATAAAVSLTVAGANAAGTAATLARSDHVHALPDAASTAYVDALPVKKACRVVMTASTAMSGLLVVDGITLVAGDRVLSTGQLVWESCGIYIAAVGGWTRAPDADTSAKLSTGMLVPIGPEGTTYANTIWQLRAPSPIVIGTSDLRHTLIGTTLASTTPANVDNTTGAVGTSNTVARADHRHAVNAGNPVALTMGAANAPGTSANLIRSDHVHALPAAAAAVALTLAGTNAQGSAATLALSDHVHALPATAAPAALTVGAASSAGASTSIVRADHVHAMPALVTASVDGFMSAADKVRLDGLEAAVRWKQAARVATPGNTNITLAGGAPNTLDGVSLALNDRVLVKNNSSWQSHGIYVVTTLGTGSNGTWTRATDNDTSAEFAAGMAVYIYEGTVNAGTVWALNAPDPINLGFTALVFSLIAGAQHVVTAGNGLVKTAAGGPQGSKEGASLAVGANADGSIVVNTNNIQVGVLATDAQHGTRGGGTTHAAVIPGGASGFITGADKTKLDGIETGAQVTSFARVQTALAAATSSVLLNAQRLSSVADPTSAQDAATRNYVDTAGQNGEFKASCRLATLPGAAAFNPQSTAPSAIDGVNVAISDRILVKDATGTLGGIWVVVTVGTGANGVWARSADADSTVKVQPGMYTFVREGVVNADTGWVLTNDTVTLSTTVLTFAQFTVSAQEKAKLDTVKIPCRVVLTANLSLSGLAAIDGITIVSGDRVLVTGQVTLSQNGIWIAASGAWSRAPDWDTSAEVTSGIDVRVTEGSAYADTQWTIVTNNPITIGTTGITLLQTPSAADKVKLDGITAGADPTMSTLANASGAVSVNSQRVTNVAAPTGNTDAINKLWLDNILLASPRPNGCRLGGHAGNPVMPADNATCTTLYFLPWVSDIIYLLVNGVQWLPCRIPTNGLSLALSGLTVGRPYDVFIVAPTTWSPAAATYTMELLAWSTTTARASALQNQGGSLYTLGSDPTRRYVGTIYARAANSFAYMSGSATVTAKCDIWNADNRVQASLYGGAAWSAGGVTVAAANTWQGINANTKLETVIGLNIGEPIDMLFDLSAILGGGTGWVGTGLDTMTGVVGDNPQITAASTADWHFIRAAQRHVQTLQGAHFLSWLIKASSTTTVKFFYQDSGFSGQMRADFYY
jgi:hypothetical protein